MRSILKWHLVPMFGGKKLDAITNEQVQRLKLKLVDRSPKTVNNVLMLFRTVLKKAVEWGELERPPCTVTMLSCPKSVMGFFDFIDYERLVVAAHRRAPTAHLMAVRWRCRAATRRDAGGGVDRRRSRTSQAHGAAVRLARTCHRAQQWAVTVSAADAAACRRTQKPTASAVVACVVSAGRITDAARPCDQSHSRGTAHRGLDARGCSHSAAHVLFAPGDERSAGACDTGVGVTRGPDHHPALYALESGGDRRRDSAARSDVPLDFRSPKNVERSGRRPRRRQ
jgi:hypothetical protein